jgi:hypothetical protein
MPEADPAERVMDRRQRDHDAQPVAQLGLDLGQRGVRGRRDQGREVRLVRFKQRPAMAAIARRRRAARLAHPAHQLDRGRGADRKRRAAPRIELPFSTARTIRSRRSRDIGGGIVEPRLSQPKFSNHNC